MKAMSDRQAFIQKYQKNLAYKDEELRKRAEARGVSVLSDEIGEFLGFYLKNKTNKEVVEIGSGYAYSTKLLHILLPEANIVSLERHAPRYEIAKTLLNHPKVEFILGDGQSYLNQREKAIDLLFLDGSKPHYCFFLQEALPLMKKGSFLIADNIFGRGFSYNKESEKRHGTLQRRMATFLDLAFKEFNATLLPLDDGLLIGEKK